MPQALQPGSLSWTLHIILVHTLGCQPDQRILMLSKQTDRRELPNVQT